MAVSGGGGGYCLCRCLGDCHGRVAVDDPMTHEFVTLSAQEPDSAVTCDRGVSLVPAAERRLHSPDATLLSIDRGSLVARCSCWWTGTALHHGRRVGVIGHYAAADEVSAQALLSRACDLLASSGAATFVGPMDGTTW